MTQLEKELAAPTLPLLPGSTDRTAVRRLQEFLVLAGFRIWSDENNAPGIDGDFGAGTSAGVSAFAAKNLLPPVVNEPFWDKLTEPMRKAFAFRPVTTDLGRAIVEVCNAHLAAKMRETRALLPNGVLRGRDNSGPYVRAVCGGQETLWCQGVASALINQATAVLGQRYSFALEGPGVLPLYVPSIVQQAEHAGQFVPGAQASPSTVRPGSLFFVRGARGGDHSHLHVGIVTEWIDARTFKTAEGNTNVDGSANGWLFCMRLRSTNGNDFGAI